MKNPGCINYRGSPSYASGTHAINVAVSDSDRDDDMQPKTVCGDDDPSLFECDVPNARTAAMMLSTPKPASVQKSTFFNVSMCANT